MLGQTSPPVHLVGSYNFRDLGGYRSEDGRRTRWRRLFRSDGLHRLTPADQKDVAHLGLASVLDLRTPEEVADEGWARVEAIRHQLPVTPVLPPMVTVPSPAAEAALVAESYLTTLRASAATMQEVLAMLTDTSTYPVVLCCSTGVDRTGIVTAIVLGLLGVPDDVVVSDYAASREATLRRIGRLRFEHPKAVGEDLDRYGPGLLGVVPEAMARFIDGVRAEHGSFVGYAESIDMAGAVSYLRAALLLPTG